MSQMDYFRRPALAGKNIQYTETGRIRGNVRRSDADGVSAVPYFPLVSAADTLNIETEAGPVAVILTANDLNTILSDINTALGVAGTAYSENGCLGLATSTTGSTGFIKVTGGTASEGLGFNTFGGVLPIEGRSSDLTGAPEGETGNPFGAVFPFRENFSSEVLTRNLGRLAANADVLWSDHIKDSVSFETVAFVVGAGGEFITPTSTQRLFVGGGLTAASTRRELAAYYQLIDTVTGLPANSQVAAVVRGTPVGAPPYADSPSWTDTSGLNILGVGANGQEKVSSEAITTITAGRFVECAAGTFVSDGVVAGDFAQIVSATNLTPASNNGMKWIVESVISETVLALRPMSKSELDTTGFYTFGIEENQPVVELNDEKSGLEVYGSLVIKTGPFAHNTTLVVSPPIPTGAVYELRAAVPGSLRDDKAQEKQLGVSAVLAEIGNDLDPTDNWILDGLVPTLSAPNCAVTAGYVRHHGKVFYIPATSFAAASFADGVNYVYWSETSGGLVATSSTAGFGSVLNNTYAVSSANRGHPVARVVRAAGVITSVDRMVRRRAEKALSFTVGTSGQFQTLEDAVRYANAISAASGETTSNSGAYPHYEFVITNNLTMTQDVTFEMPGVTLRGVDSRTILTAGGQRFNMSGSTTELLIKDLILSGTSSAFLQVTNSATRVSLVNIRHLGAYGSLVRSSGGGLLEELFIDSCVFTCDNVTDIQASVALDAKISLLRSDFSFAFGSLTPQILKDTADVIWSGGRLLIDGCRFISWATTSAVNALAFDAANVSGDIVVRNTTFSLGDHASADNSVLMAFNGRSIVENVKITGKIPRAINGYGARTKVIDSTFLVNPEATAAAIYAAEVSGCSVSHVDTDANVVGGIGVQVTRAAWNNTIGGRCSVGIRITEENVVVSNNLITLSSGIAKPLIGIESAEISDCRITGNSIFMPARPSAEPEAPPVGIAHTADVFSRIFIENNAITLAENGSCIQVGTAALPVGGENLSITNNNVSALCTLGGTAIGIDLHGTVLSILISGQQVSVSGGGSGSGIFQADGNYTNMLTTGNRIFVDSTNGSGGVYFVSVPNDSQDVTDNIFEAGASNQKVSGFRGVTTGNQFLAAGTFLFSDTQGVFCDNYVEVALGSATLGPGRYDNNTFTIPNVNTSTVISDFQFTNNRLSGNYNGGAPITNTFTMFNGNKVAGTTAIGAAADTKVVITGNELLGTLTINAGTGDHDVILSGTYVGGDAAIATNRHLTISDCVFVGTGTQTVLGGGHVAVEGNSFTGRVSMDGSSSDQLVSNNKLSSGIAFTYDASPVFWKVEGNRIQSAYNVTSVAFPAFTFPAQTFITISNNTIQHGCGEDTAGLAATVSAIHFAGNVGSFAVTGNNIAIGRNNTKNDPGGGAGTTNVACLHIVGAGAANGPNVISSNYMDIPNTLIFVHTYAYKFWYFGSSTNTGGAGNILVQNNAVTAGSPYEGQQFFSAGVAAPYNVP